MQATIKKALKTNDGSVLVGVVVLCAVMAIAASGLIGMSRNTINQEVDAYNDAAAYLAAETGLLRGTAWFRDRSGADVASPVVGLAFPIFLHDGILVEVTIAGPDDLDDQFIRLRSTAWHPDLPYGKRLEWGVYSQAQDNPAVYGYFIDQPDSDAGCAVGKTGGFRGFRGNVIYEAAVHFNGPVVLDHNDRDIIRFLDRVTVFNPPQGQIINGVRGIYEDYGIGAPPRSNNYNRGVEWSGSVGVESEVLDNVFRSTYRAIEEQHTVTFVDPFPNEGIDANGLMWHFLPTPSNSANAENSFLKFGVNGGTETLANANAVTSILNNSANRCNDCYTFFRREGTSFIPYVRQIPQDDTKLIIQAGRVGTPTNLPFGLQVRDGTMSGSVSVRTVGNQDITIDLQKDRTNNGNLIYNVDNAARDILWETPTRQTGATGAHRIIPYVEKHKPNNYGLNGTDDILAFYSDRHLRLTTPSGNPTPNQARITAQLFAPNGQVYPADNNASFTYNIFGALVARCWWNYSGNSNINDLLRVFHDQRAIRAPGVGMSGDDDDDDGGGDMVPDRLFVARWLESNVIENRPGL